MQKMLFKRKDWRSKKAVIQLQRGFSIRLSKLEPDLMYHDLIAFCEEHCISYEKTKNYKLIERMNVHCLVRV